MDGFTTVGTKRPWIEKRPDEVLDYVIGLSDWLPAGATLASVSADADVGLTVLNSPAPAVSSVPITVTLQDETERTFPAGEAVVIWLSSGTVDARYAVTVTCPVVNSPLVVQRSFEVRVVE